MPVAFLGGMSRASKEGVVVKGGAVLEQLAKVRSAAFDKTGTLTAGRPALVGIQTQLDPDELLQLVASAEQFSTHVMAAGLTAALADRGCRCFLPKTRRKWPPTASAPWSTGAG